ncbi:MAG: FAD-dependent oxidoreductase, partial [Candidatus Omnitrophica bacterium]|nr:FAD-dependent oxidoreductase [Candidatus Omnitrophota bacterium]
MLEILERITRGQGQEDDLEKLERLGKMIKKTALCGLGQTAPNPVLSTLRYFRNEYESHIREKFCPAAVCADLFVSPCQHTCPVHIDIPVFIGQIKHNQTEEALRTILKRNILPSVCGRVCHHPCQAHCRRGKIDQPVSIMLLKRFAADYDQTGDLPLVETTREKRPEKIAVIGSGPAGLACASWLLRLGYQVTIFEAEKKLGGMLRLGIPQYRLPRKVLDRDIKRIIKAGLKIKTGVRLGKEITLNDLRTQGFKAFFLGIGAWQEVPLKIPGAELSGVIGSLAFLKAYNCGQIKKTRGIWTFTNGKEKVPITGRSVAVIGGGNAAMDVARTCLRLGANEVHVIYRRSREAMPAIPEEVQEAEKEGVKFHFLLIPTVIRGENGAVKEIECALTQPGEFDETGRRQAVATEKREKFPVELVITAIGGRPEIPPGLKGELALTPWGTIKIDPLTLATSQPGVFAGGDVVTGGGTVINSMADGEKAAISIDRYLRGENLNQNRFVYCGQRHSVPESDLPGELTTRVPAEEPEQLPLRDRLAGFEEVEKGYRKGKAISEASRCLRCDRKEN